MMRAVVILAITVQVVLSHPLYDYCKQDDGAYSYQQLDGVDYGDVTLHLLNMTSQKWLDEDYTTQPTWFHYMAVAVPDQVVIPDQAFIFVGLGDNTDDPIDPDEDFIVPFLMDMARQLGAVTALINQVPNQPIYYTNDEPGNDRSEDSSIAWTWMEWITAEMNGENPDPALLLLYPMTKSVVRAMDTVTDLVQREHDFSVDKYVIGGPSKRGWTTYLVGAVDERVVGIVPQVLSILNFVPNMHHHYQSLGGWSFAFKPYWNENLTPLLDSNYTKEMIKLCDPYELRENLTLPKLIVKASMDEFFMLDDTPFFLDDLPGPTHLLVLENTNHPMLLQWQRLADSIASFFLMVYNNVEWPEYTYAMESDETAASITMRLEQAPVSVTAWVGASASNDRRDWRFLRAEGDDRVINGVFFFEEDVEDLGDNTYRIALDAPEEGYTGFFMTVAMPGPTADSVFEFSSQPLVVPNTFPYEDCEGEGCLGTIV